MVCHQSSRQCTMTWRIYMNKPFKIVWKQIDLHTQLKRSDFWPYSLRKTNWCRTAKQSWFERRVMTIHQVDYRWRIMLSFKTTGTAVALNQNLIKGSWEWWSRFLNLGISIERYFFGSISCIQRLALRNIKIRASFQFNATNTKSKQHWTTNYSYYTNHGHLQIDILLHSLKISCLEFKLFTAETRRHNQKLQSPRPLLAWFQRDRLLDCCCVNT